MIGIDHTVQMGHRLWSLPGKCTQLHGHTWHVHLSLSGPRQSNGLMIDYHHLKKEFRGYLDEAFDHRLCLDANDPLVKEVLYNKEFSRARKDEILQSMYPGLVTVDFLPSTENMAELWACAAKALFGDKYIYTCSVTEGDLNHASITVE